MSGTFRLSKRASSYYCDFQQKLINGGIYSHIYRHPNGKDFTPPTNWDLINKALAQPRPLLLLLYFSTEAFKKFV